MSVITPMRIVFAACARLSRGSDVTSPAVAPVPSRARRVRFMLVRLQSRLSAGRCCCRSAPYQRAATFGERPEGLIRRGGLQQLVVVPGTLRFGRRLHLE